MNDTNTPGGPYEPQSQEHTPSNPPPYTPQHTPPSNYAPGQYAAYGQSQTTAYTSPHYDGYTPMPHSGLGIASFALSILSGVVIFALVVTAAGVEASTPGGMDEDSALAVVLGLLMIGSVLLDFVALGLGIASLFQTTRKKIFGIFGIAITLATIGCFGLLLIVGLLAG